MDFDIARDKELDHGRQVLKIWKGRKILYKVGTFDSLDQQLEGKLKHRIGGKESVLLSD